MFRSAPRTGRNRGILFGDILPVVITVEKSCEHRRRSKEPNKTKVGKVTRKQVMNIVKLKGKNLNSRNDDAGFKIIAGTTRLMGLEIVD